MVKRTLSPTLRNHRQRNITTSSIPNGLWSSQPFQQVLTVQIMLSVGRARQTSGVHERARMKYLDTTTLLYTKSMQILSRNPQR